MKTTITNKNCDFEKQYLIEELADSSIEIEFEFDRIITIQSKKALLETLAQDILKELRRYKWLILGKVQIEIHWFINAVQKQETDKIGDLDNITKPIIDTLAGINGILIDDSQINSIHTTWITKNNLKKDNIVKLLINFNNDFTVVKENLYFLQTSKVIYTPLNFDKTKIDDVKGIKFFIEAFKMKRVFSKLFKNESNIDVERYLVCSEYEFHRTRLNGFNKNQIISNGEFEELCKKLELA